MRKLATLIKLTLPIVVISLAAGGCRHKELDDEPDPTIQVRVIYDWSESEGANPSGMVAFFYDTRSGEMRRFDFPGTEGGIVNLPQGDWHVITFNNDSEIVQSYSHNEFEKHTGFTRAAHILEGALGPNASGDIVTAVEDEAVVATTDEMWGQSRQTVPVYADPATGMATVELFPHPLTCHYSYEIRNVSNLNHVVNLCGSLSGMSGELTYSTEELGRQRVTLPYGGYISDQTTIRGEFYTFGHHEENYEPHRMTMYLWMDDGRKLVYGLTRSSQWDVTDQIHDAPNRRRVHIIVDGGMEVPVDVPVGGFNPGADNWGEEDRFLDI